jgi:D-3-phosphoglycerate dehydrogenase
MKYKVLITDGMAPEGQEILNKHTDILDVEVCKGLSPDELLKKAETAHGIVIRSATKLTSEVIAVAKELKAIGRAGIGTDNIDIPAATAAGAIVMNTPDSNAITTAEHSVSLLMATARRIPLANKSLWDGAWDRKTFVGTELFGKTAGVVGLGNIGKLVAERLIGLQLDVIAYDPYANKELAESMGVKLVDSLDELLTSADIITLHVPLLDATKNLLDKEQFAKMKDGAILIHCARGGIVSETALLEALESKKLKAVGMDVFEKEPVDPKNPLLSHPLVVATPHLGAQTKEAQINVSIAIAQQMVAYFKSGEIKNAVNFPSLSGGDALKVKPLALLGEKLANFIAQWDKNPIKDIKIHYEGDLCDFDTRSVTLSIAKGILTKQHGDRVNYVNALNIAKDSGVHLVETKTKDCKEFNSLITIEASSNGNTHTISGALFGKSEPRLVHLNGLDFESEFSDHMLVLENEDHPGVVGAIGTVLGKNKINIENMQLTLKKDSGKALSVVSVTSEVSKEALQEIEKQDFVTSAKYIRL